MAADANGKTNRNRTTMTKYISDLPVRKPD
jgi:hypothetical protein